jgi:hypothetical protein
VRVVLFRIRDDDNRALVALAGYAQAERVHV